MHSYLEVLFRTYLETFRIKLFSSLASAVQRGDQLFPSKLTVFSLDIFSRFGVTSDSKLECEALD